MSMKMTLGLSAYLGVTGGSKLAKRKEDVSCFEKLGLPKWMLNFAGVTQVTAATCLLIPPLRPIGVLASSAAGGGALAGMTKDKSTAEAAMRDWTTPMPAQMHESAGDARYIPLALTALQLLFTESIAAASGQRPLWMVVGLVGGFSGMYGSNWKMVPPDVSEKFEFDLAQLVEESKQAASQ